jgi:predicted transglutaminase-like cysteine proteinase
MKRQLIKLFLSIFLLLVPISGAYSDVVYLKNGRQLEGIIITENKEYVEVNVGFGFVKFYHEAIEKVEYSSEEGKQRIEKLWKKRKEEYANSVYKKAVTNYDEAIKEEKETNITKAFIYYKIAIENAQEAYNLVNSSQKIELNKILGKSRSRVNDLAGQKEKIESLKYARLNNPSEISKWLSKNVTYKSDWLGHSEKDYWQNPKETIILKSGDCEDYAFLSQALLNEIGIKSSVILILYKTGSGEKGHAICVFPKKPPYNCFSGQKLHILNKSSIVDVVKELYPSWFSMSELNLFQHSRTPILKRS